MLPRSMAGGPWSGSVSWRYASQRVVTIEVLVGVLLVCLGLLLGTSWTVQALQPRLRRQAEERRRLNEEWSVVRTA
jgi:sulfite exporter TauE/SafE